MTKQRILTDKVLEAPPGLWSNCIRVKDTIFVAGMTAKDFGGPDISGLDEYQQAKIIFIRIRDLVEAAGGAINDVVKLTIFLVDVSKNQEVWRARQEFFSGDFPTCSLVEVSRLTLPEIKVEIEAIAIAGCSKGN